MWAFFNETIIQLVEDLKILFPNDSSLVLINGSLKICIATKPKILQQAFQIAASPYFQKILAHDETFFMEHSEQDYLQDAQRFKDDERFTKEIETLREEMSTTHKIIDSLKMKWVEMDSHNKGIIWKYLCQLVMLNEKCNCVE